MPFTTIFCDLDDTLYPSGNGLWEAIGQRMNRFMVERVKLPEDQVPSIRRHYYQTYGTTLRGLQIHHAVDADEYLAYVHDLDLEQFLHPDACLRDMLFNLPQKIWIFTNADAAHAGRVVAVLGLENCFEGIIDVRSIQFACKPENLAYERALALAGNPLPAQCILLDDSAVNLVPAFDMGLSTVWINQNGSSHPSAVHTLSKLIDLRDVMPELWGLNIKQAGI
jgi:putative hydrolase of the HAD superfamily